MLRKALLLLVVLLSLLNLGEAIKAEERYSWPDLMGMEVEEAKTYIRQSFKGDIEVHDLDTWVKPETVETRRDRVRVFVKEVPATNSDDRK